MHTDCIELNWIQRETPLKPRAIVGIGSVAVALAKRAMQVPEQTWVGMIAEQVLLLTNKNGELPWVDGAIYLGKDSGAKNLYMPTLLQPDQPLTLVENNLRKTAKVNSGALAVLPQQQLLVDMRQTQTLSLDELAAFINPATSAHA